MSTEVIKVPDIGADSAEVIEILVAVGDQLDPEQSLVALESDKASLEVPSPIAGRVLSINVAIGDQLSEGMELIQVEVAGEAETSPEPDSESTPAQEEPSAQETSSTSQDTAPEKQSEMTAADILCLVPDLGADSAEIVEVMVAVGDEVAEGDSLVVAESDKASLELPAEHAGTIVALHVAEKDKIQQGGDLVTISAVGVGAVEADVYQSPVESPSEPAAASTPEEATEQASSGPVDMFVPDMGSDSAEIIEIPVSVGDRVEEGDTLVVVETDKASVEVPAEAPGEITALHVEVGGKITQGDQLATLIVESAVAPVVESAVEVAKPTAVETPSASEVSKAEKPQPSVQPVVSSGNVHAGPSVRKLARQLGVDLARVTATGQRGRIQKDDVHAYVKQQLQAPSSSGSAGIPEIPAVDWQQFGEIDVQSMSRIGKVTAANMSRNWLNVPHVTQFDDADVTELEQYRTSLKPEGVSRGVKMTPLAFLLKASAVALKENPKFNTALHQNGEDLVERKFFHLSIAVDTPMGLMVPVIRDVDQKDIWQLAEEVTSLAGKAKAGKLSPKEMQGASFTISSLGAIGGTGFTPIVPAPQVGILGVSKTSIQPVWDGVNFVPRKLMPLALSYDHRVVNGADAGKFMTCVVEVLGDLNRIWNG